MEKRTDKQNNFIWTYGRPLLVSLFFGAFLITALLLLGAFVLLKMGRLDPAILNGFSIAILIIAGFVSGWTVGRILRKNGLLLGALAGVSLYIVVWIVSMSCGFFAQFNALSGVRLLMILFSGAIGGLFSVNKRKKI